MKVKLNDEIIASLDPWEENVIKNDIKAEEFEYDMKRRLQYTVYHKLDRCFKRFEEEWMEKLLLDPTVDFIPADKKKFVEMVMERPDYKSRSQREE